MAASASLKLGGSSLRPADEAAKLHATTWGEELRTLEHQKRRTVDPELLKGPAIRVQMGMVRSQERTFDPIVQRYRDPHVEHHTRSREENARVGHLNRAKDIQVLRETPWNVVTNASQLEGIDEGIDPVTLTHTRPRVGRMKMPDTLIDYNLLSNLPMQEHHWARPEERPKCMPLEPRNRKVPAFMQKDYDIVTNRYLHDHEAQLGKDRELNKLVGTAKFRERNRFNPLTQQYTDGDENLRMRNWEEASRIEATERQNAQFPPSQKNRPTAYWNLINHRQANADTLKWVDLAEDERKERYKNRYIVENNLHVRDINSNMQDNERRLNRIAHERYAEPLRRGYDIVAHDTYAGPASKPPYLPYPAPHPDVWERVHRHRDRDVNPEPNTDSRFFTRSMKSSEQVFGCSAPPPSQSRSGGASASARADVDARSRRSGRSELSRHPASARGARSERSGPSGVRRSRSAAALPTAPVPRLDLGRVKGAVYSQPV